MKKTMILILGLLILVGIVYAAPGDETVVLTRQIDIRKNVDYPIWEAVITGTWDDDDTADVTQAISLNGTIQKIVLVAPDGTNSVTYQVVIKDNDGNTVFDSGEQAETATYVFSVHEPITGTWSVIIGPSGALGATHPDVVVYIRGI